MRVVVSAGGTGGHIYPALAIINKIKDNISEVLFIPKTKKMVPNINLIEIIFFNLFLSYLLTISYPP